MSKCKNCRHHRENHDDVDGHCNIDSYKELLDNGVSYEDLIDIRPSPTCNCSKFENDDTYRVDDKSQRFWLPL
jgi:hypothetical protein